MVPFSNGESQHKKGTLRVRVRKHFVFSAVSVVDALESDGLVQIHQWTLSAQLCPGKSKQNQQEETNNIHTRDGRDIIDP